MKAFFGESLRPDDFHGVPQPEVGPDQVHTILQIVFALAGGIALIVLILAGMRYILSRGEPAEVAKAKNAILYAVIGLVVSVAAFSIVSLVVKSV